MNKHRAVVKWYWWGKSSPWRKTYPRTTLATTNPTQTVLRFNPGLRNDGLATNCLGHGFRQPTWCHSKITYTIWWECNRLVIYPNFYKCRQSWVQYISKRFILKQTHYQYMQKTSPCNIQCIKAIAVLILGAI